MSMNDDGNDDKPERPEQRPESITDQLSFKSRFVFIFGDINHQTARATCAFSASTTSQPAAVR